MEPPDPSAAVEAVGKLSFLEGNWEGGGWVQTGPDERIEFRQTELVETRLDGGLLLVEGIGHDTGDAPRRVHHALAVAAYDPITDSVRWLAFVPGRPVVDVEPLIGDGHMQWGFEPAPGARVRFRIDVEERTWHQVGEFSRDGESWHEFIEMTLMRRDGKGDRDDE